MKVSKTVIGTAIGVVAGGAIGYFAGREVERRYQEDLELENYDADAYLETLDISEEEPETAPELATVEE